MKNSIRWIVSGGMLVVIALVVFSQYGRNRPSSVSSPSGGASAPSGPPAMPVAAARVESGAGTLEVTAVGSLQANESSVIRSEIAGRITAIPFKEGEPVAKGAVLLMINSEEYEAQVKQIGAVVELDKMNFERAKQLRAEELISDRGYEEAAAKLKESEASFSLAQIRLEKSTLRAPFNGRLGLRQVSPGDYVQPGQAIVTLEETDTMKVDFRVPEIYRGRIDIGRPVQVRVDAFPAETFSGKLYAIDARVDEATRTVLLRARIPNPNRMLHPGIFARVVLDLGGREKTLFIPEQAIVPMAGEKFVYRIVDGKAMLTKVRIGMRKEGKVEIVEGLGPQETVVTEGQMKLFDGASVTAMNMAKPEAKPEEGTKGG